MCPARLFAVEIAQGRSCANPVKGVKRQEGEIKVTAIKIKQAAAIHSPALNVKAAHEIIAIVQFADVNISLGFTIALVAIQAPVTANVAVIGDA